MGGRRRGGTRYCASRQKGAAVRSRRRTGSAAQQVHATLASLTWRPLGGRRRSSSTPPDDISSSSALVAGMFDRSSAKHVREDRLDFVIAQPQPPGEAVGELVVAAHPCIGARRACELLAPRIERGSDPGDRHLAGRIARRRADSATCALASTRTRAVAPPAGSLGRARPNPAPQRGPPTGRLGRELGLSNCLPESSVPVLDVGGAASGDSHSIVVPSIVGSAAASAASETAVNGGLSK